MNEKGSGDKRQPRYELSEAQLHEMFEQVREQILDVIVQAVRKITFEAGQAR